MKEFIVWDKDNKEWMKYCHAINNVGNIVHITEHGDTEFVSKDNLTIHQYIGKTDTEGNKIYADCSIVEFMHKGKWLYLNGITGESKHEDIKMKGYFQFHEDKLRYELIILDWDKKKSESIFSVLPYNMETIANLKIIDTIQENKLGLIKSMHSDK